MFSLTNASLYFIISLSCNVFIALAEEHQTQENDRIIFCPDDGCDQMKDNATVCKLPSQLGVLYECVFEDARSGASVRACDARVPVGVTVLPRCDSPIYYSPMPLPPMRCIHGRWDRVAVCIPDCGKLTTTQQPLSIGGVPAARGEVPWHVGVYRKEDGQHDLVCGGSILTSALVVTAAHCFWNEFEGDLYPYEKYAVAAGKLYRKWNAHQDSLSAQKSDITDIKIPLRFRGRETNYQEDIALVFLSSAFSFKANVLPVCIDFNEKFNEEQLQNGVLGKVAGWGFISEDGYISPKLKVVHLPYIDIGRCLNETEFGFHQFITGDKICAGYNNGTAALCRGDSGGGLVFAVQEGGALRYYLRGLASTANRHEDDTKHCNSRAIPSFTQIYSQRAFLRNYFSDRTRSKCVLPEQPEKGLYEVEGLQYATPGQSLSVAVLRVSCHTAYTVGETRLSCAYGRWDRTMPLCLQRESCPELSDSDGVHYECHRESKPTSDLSLCVDEYSNVTPSCKSNYFSTRRLENMTCSKNSWNYIPDCRSVCEKTPVKHRQAGEFPWHVEMYDKSEDRFKRICGGSIISSLVILTGAVCVWDTNRRSTHPASKYAVAAGKLFSQWDTVEPNSQKRNVSRIIIPARFIGIDRRFSDDIAIVTVVNIFEFNLYVQPVVVTFDTDVLDSLVLSGHGQIPSWHFNDTKQRIVAMQHVDIITCIKEAAPRTFIEFITSDKFCGTSLNNDECSTLCTGDSGAGLVFASQKRKYLYGITSVAPATESRCSNFVAFTDIKSHDTFLQDTLLELKSLPVEEK